MLIAIAIELEDKYGVEVPDVLIASWGTVATFQPMQQLQQAHCNFAAGDLRWG